MSVSLTSGMDSIQMESCVPSEGVRHLMQGNVAVYSTAELRRISANACKADGRRMIRWAVSVNDGGATVRYLYMEKDGRVGWANVTL